MTQTSDTGTSVGRTAEPQTVAHEEQRLLLTPTEPRPWWRRPWVLPGMLIAFAFIVLFVPPYLTFDPATARLPNLREDISWHYPILVGHILFGTVAMATVPFQVWARFRERWPAAHRFMGRAYVISVIPSGVAALLIVPFAMGPAGNTIGALLWMGATLVGFRKIRQRKYAEHRRWMIYSFALCMQIIEGRVMVLTIPHLPAFEPTSFPLLLETASWIGILLNLLVAQWWIERTARRNSAAVPAARVT